MACQPGEENVATLFGDVHYFYGLPTDNPPHHRFDKGSYVYLFENAHEARARIEIANQPGTDDQDAFDGFFDNIQVRYSYKQQCVVSLTVGDVPNQEEWHLPTYDPHNENKYHYKLHSIDIYFWTQQDALQFVNGVRRVIPAHQVEVLDEPGPPPRQQQQQQHAAHDASGLVQRLENVAISSEGGNAGRQQQQQQQPGVPSFAPPPISAVSGSSNDVASPASFAPIPYNPAAPPAPEALRHREKTPPPEDGGMNPLHQTLVSDAATPFSPGLAPSGMSGPLSPGIPPPQFAHIPGAPSFPGPPAPALAPAGGLASPGLPPPGFGGHPGLARAHTMPASQLGGTPLASPYGANFPASPGFAPQHFQQHPGMQPQQHQTPTPPGSTSTPGLPPPPPPPQAQSVPPGVGAGPGSSGGPGGAGMGHMDYSIHGQVYRPEEHEMRKYKPKLMEGRGGKLEENAGRLERGVTGMFKKFEKKFG